MLTRLRVVNNGVECGHAPHPTQGELRSFDKFLTARSKYAILRMMKRGRPREFDRSEALEKAMHVFWNRGYESASVQDLLDGMGINRGSMYAAFGNKRALFLAALTFYQEQVVRQMLDVLAGPGSPQANIRKLLTQIAKNSQAGACRGCLLTNTTVADAPHDRLIASRARDALAAIEHGLVDALKRGVEAGQIAPRKNVQALARFYVGVLQALVVLGKARVGEPALRDVIDVAMCVIE
jgi:TetR/AcrR family transcriptional repressor of nem operon